jgi:hypothetical protein
LDRLGTDPLIGSYHLAQFLRIQLGGKGGRIDEVTKQYRELATFGCRSEVLS